MAKLKRDSFSCVQWHGMFAGVAGALACLMISAPIAGAAPGGSGALPLKGVSLEETAERVRVILQTGRTTAPVPPPAAPAPPASAPPPTAWSSLRVTIDAADQWLKDFDARFPQSKAFVSLATNSLRHADDAHQAMIQVETDFLGALRHLRKAARDLTNARAKARQGSDEDAWAVRILNELADVGARLAEDGILRARNGGVPPARLDAAARSLEEGLRLKAAGVYVLAFDQFEDPVLAGAIPVFDLDLFEQNIISAFDQQSVGYQYAIARDGAIARTSTFGETGLARTNADPPNTSQDATKEINIASISKTITATVLLRLLDERNESVDNPIAPWLPSSWPLGPGIGPGLDPQLTFRDLLNHVSGLDGNQKRDYRYADLLSYASAGIVQSDKATEVYQNANFAMFRVAIPYLRYGENGVNQIAALAPFAPFDEVIAGLYIQTVRDYAFEPTGFVEAGCVASDAAPTILYPFPSGGLPGRQPDDWTVRCGSGGWYMSTVELVGVMAFRRYTNLVMSAAARQLMDNSFLGWANPATNPYASGLYGVYRSHGGDLGKDPGDPGLGACYMEFFNGVQAAVIINSKDGAYAYQCSELKAAFEGSFAMP